MALLSHLDDFGPLVLIYMLFYILPLSIGGMGLLVAFLGVFYRSKSEDGNPHSAKLKFGDFELELNGSNRFSLVFGGVVVAILGTYISFSAPEEKKPMSIGRGEVLVDEPK